MALLTGCAVTEPAPLSITFLPERGEFADASGKRLTFHQALHLAAGADYVILGEGHRNQCDHDMQQRVVRGLVQLGRRPAIGLEMVPVTLQPVLDRFHAGEIKAGELAKALDWSKTWGYPYALFAPLFTLAEQEGLPLAGLNAPREVTRKVGREGIGTLTAAQRAHFPARVIPHLPEQEAELEAVFAAHGSRLDQKTDLERFLLVQDTWDTMMAEQGVALRGRTHRPVVLIAGAGHVERGLGIPRRIRMLDPGASVVTLVPLRSVDWFRPGLGTAVFYCPESYVSRMGMTLEVRSGRVVVVEVRPAGRAATAGIRPGDELVRAQGIAVRGLMDLHRAGKRAHDQNRSLKFTLERRGERVHVDLGKLGKQGKSGKADKPDEATGAAESADAFDSMDATAAKMPESHSETSKANILK